MITTQIYELTYSIKFITPEYFQRLVSMSIHSDTQKSLCKTISRIPDNCITSHHFQFLKIIHDLIYLKLKQDISRTQLGFRNEFGSRDSRSFIFYLNDLILKTRDFKKDLCFIDYEKAFDRASHTKLFNIIYNIY